MKIAIVGTGYVGLVTGTCFAENGNQVTCIDVDKLKVKSMQNGKIPIYEPGLEELFRRNTAAKRLSFTTDLLSGIKDSRVIFLCLPTPSNEDGSADLSYVLSVADAIGPHIEAYTVIVNKSTVPVGTAEKVHETIVHHTTIDFDVVSNPEFLREGMAVEDFMYPDRIVVGTTSKHARSVMRQLYQSFVQAESSIIFMDQKSAEITKYAANAFLSTKISFMNEVARLSELVGANVDDVRLGIGSDERIGKKFLKPGPGFGGSCFPKDVLALQKTAKNHEYRFRILDAVLNVNQQQQMVLYEKVFAYYKGNLSDKTIAVWGLSFKADTDDVRESSALKIIRALLDAGAHVRVSDPAAIENSKNVLGPNDSLFFFEDEYEALKEADALVIVTDWSEYRAPDFTVMKHNLKQPVIFDGRNLYELDNIAKQGFYYNSLGRKVVLL